MRLSLVTVTAAFVVVVEWLLGKPSLFSFRLQDSVAVVFLALFSCLVDVALGHIRTSNININCGE